MQRPDAMIRDVMPESVRETLNLRLGMPGVSAATLLACMLHEQPEIPGNLKTLPPSLAAAYLLERLSLESAKEYVRMYLECFGIRSDYVSDLIPLLCNVPRL